MWDDATADRYDTFFYAAFTGDLLPKLNVKLDRNFIPGTDYYMHWDKEEKKGTTGEELRYAMTRRPGMRAFFANGWFDLCTEWLRMAYNGSCRTTKRSCILERLPKWTYDLSW